MRSQHASTVPPKRSKMQLNETRKKMNNSNSAAAGGGGAGKGLQLYSLSKLVADVTSSKPGSIRTPTTVATFAKTPISHYKEVNRLVALTKTTTSIKRTIPSAREEQKQQQQQQSTTTTKKSPEDVQRNLQATKKTNELRAQDYWDRFRESKLEKMRQHKLNVEQRMRDNNGVADNYSYYWDNINHCYSDQTQLSKHRNQTAAAASAKAQRAQIRMDAEDHSLPASWYTDNIYNGSIDLDEDDFRQRMVDDNAQRAKRRTRRNGINRNSCDINGNSPYRHGFEEVLGESELDEEDEAEEEDLRNNNRSFSHGNRLVDRYCAHLKPTTPTKYQAQSNRSMGAFPNGGAGADTDPDESLLHADKSIPRRGIPKSKSFGQQETRTSRGRFGLGTSFLWQGRRSKTTNLLMDIQSRFRRGTTSKHSAAPVESRYNGAGVESTGQLPSYPRSRYNYCDTANQNDFEGCDRSECCPWDRQQDVDDHNGRSFLNRRRGDFRGQRNRSLDDDFYRRRSRFNFHHNLLLNSEDEEEGEADYGHGRGRGVDVEEDSDFGFYSREIDYNNNLQRGGGGAGAQAGVGIGDPSEAYYQHQEAINRPPIRPSTLNISGQRFTRGRSLDDYEYSASHRSRNLNFIDKNLNIVNFLNSARNIPQEFHADVVEEHHLQQQQHNHHQQQPEMVTEQIFNPNVEYRQQQHPRSFLNKSSKINRMRNFSSLDLDWETDPKGILERTSAIFGNLINSPQSPSSLDDIAMAADNDILMCPVVEDLNFISSNNNATEQLEPMPKKSCMKKTPTSNKTPTGDFVMHHPQQELDYKLNTYYPQEEFNEPPNILSSCHHHHHHPMGLGVTGLEDLSHDEIPDEEIPHLGLGDSFHLENNCCSSLNNNNLNNNSNNCDTLINLDATNGNLLLLSDEEEEEEEERERAAAENGLVGMEHPSSLESPLDPNTLHIINNIFSIYKPNQYSPVNCHNPTLDNVKVDNYCKKISLPSTMRPLGDHAMPGQSKVDMDDECYLLSDQNNNNVVPHDAYDDCFVEGPSAILGGNRRRKSTFFASLKRPLCVVKSKSCHDSVAAADDHWFCSGDLMHKEPPPPLSSSTNHLAGLQSPTDSNNSLLEKTGLFKFSPTSTTETSYFYPFDYYFNAANGSSTVPPPAMPRHPHQITGTKKKSLIKLRSTTRPLSFSH